MRISDWSSDVCSSDLIHVDRQHEPVSPYEYGMFIEPIGSLVARTLWAEMLDDRKFYFPVVDAAHDPELPTGVEGRPAMPLRKWRPIGDEIGRAHVCNPVTNAHLVCRLVLEKNNTN